MAVVLTKEGRANQVALWQHAQHPIMNAHRKGSRWVNCQNNIRPHASMTAEHLKGGSQGACPLLPPPASDDGVVVLFRLARPVRQARSVQTTICHDSTQRMYGSLCWVYTAAPDRFTIHGTLMTWPSCMVPIYKWVIGRQEGQPYLLDVRVGNVVPDSGNFSLYFVNCQPQSAVSFDLKVHT